MLRVRTSFSGPSGTPWLSTFYFSGNDSQSGATDANNAVGAFWSAVDNFMRTGITWGTLAQVDELTAAGVLVGGYPVTPATGAGGDAATGQLPSAVQALVTWDTGAFVGGRRIKGRTFIPGLTEAQNFSNSLEATFSAALTTAATTLNALASPELSVWSKTNNAVITVSAAQVSPKWAVLRSRRD